MSREAPVLPTKPPKPGSWWIKMGLGAVVLLLIAGIGGLEVRREQLRGVLREAAHTPVAALPRGPRPVFFQVASEEDWAECIQGLPSYWEGDGTTSLWVPAIEECASRTNLQEPRRYLGFRWGERITEHATTLEPRECARLSFAVLRIAHDLLHLDRARDSFYGSSDVRLVRAGLHSLLQCGGDDALQVEMRLGLSELEADLPSIRILVEHLREIQRLEAYRWLARTAWDYDDPFFYETSGLLSRYRRQLAEWGRWQRISAIFDAIETTEDAARRIDALRTEQGLYLYGLEADVEHLSMLRGARMLLGGPIEEDPSTGLPMRREPGCAAYRDGAICIPGGTISTLLGKPD